MRLDRFLSNLPRFSRADARLLLAAGRLRVDGATVRDGRHEIREFSRIELDDELLQAGKPARYFMLNKPCLLYTSPSPRDRQKSRMPSSA